MDQDKEQTTACSSDSRCPSGTSTQDPCRKSDWNWRRTSARIDWKTKIELSEDIKLDLLKIYDTMCEVTQRTTTEPSLRKHSATVQAPAIHAQLTGNSPCHAMLLLPIKRFLPWLLHSGVLPGVTQWAWLDESDSWEPFPATKFVQRYSQHRTGYHFRIMLFGESSKLPKKIAGSMTAVILFSKKTPSSFTCWIFNETNLSPSLPPPGRSRGLCRHLWEHFGFLNALNCDDAVRIQDLFLYASASQTESFQKFMPPLIFSAGADECTEFVLDITNRSVRTIVWNAMHNAALVRRRLVTGYGEGISVRMLFSQRDKIGQISAEVTLRPSFLMDSVPVSSLEISFTQVTPWEVVIVDAD